MTSSTENRQRSSTNANTPPATTDDVDIDTELLKSDSQDDSWSSSGYNYINPFVHQVNIDKPYEICKIYVLTVLLLPIRVVGCVVSLITAWIFASIGLYGCTMDDLQKKPLTGWRRHFQKMTAVAMRGVFAAGSFHNVTFKGQRASPKEAPILVVAPHSSYVDSIIVVVAGPPSIVAKRETASIPLLGKIINFSQPIYVLREDPNSRQNTIQEIVRRAHSEEEWPQVVIFSEGTCTNRKALIKFKPGAFYPGVPVQPVLLHFPNKYDSFTWTWQGPSFTQLLWLTMSQFYNRCEVEYLPVYKPNEAEKLDANLFADNVRNVMARALNVPTSEYSFEDVTVMNRAKDMKIPFPGDIVEIESCLNKLDLLNSKRDTELAADYKYIAHADQVNFQTFAELLHIDPNTQQLQQLFSLLDHHRIGIASLKSFLLCSFFCKYLNEDINTFLQVITNIYADSHESITRESFYKMMRHTGKLSIEQCNELFTAIDTPNKGTISYVEFENYARDQPEYTFLYRRQEQIRRPLRTK